MPISSIQLQIETQPIKLELRTELGVFNLQKTPHQFQINTEPATVEITSRPYGTLEIDQSPCRASYGIYEHPEFMRRAADLGRQTAFETIARIAAEGDRMAAIETGEPVFANMAAESTIGEPLDITVVTIARPDIRYTPNPPRFKPIPGRVDISFEPENINIDFRQSKVQGTITQYPTIHFSTTGNNIDIAK